MNTQLKKKCENFDFKELFNKKGYAYFTQGMYNLNLIGVRASGNQITNTFNDILVVDYKDEFYDFTPNTEEKGIFGINLHRANQNIESQLIDKWSAGCQVFASPVKFNEFLKLCEAQINNGMGKYFTYTLINEEDM